MEKSWRTYTSLPNIIPDLKFPGLILFTKIYKVKYVSVGLKIEKLNH